MNDITKFTPITVGDIEFIPAMFYVGIGGKPIKLNANQYRVFYALCARVGHVKSISDLMRCLYGDDVRTDGAVKVHICSLRKALGVEHTRVETVKSVGYRLSTPSV